MSLYPPIFKTLKENNMAYFQTLLTEKGAFEKSFVSKNILDHAAESNHTEALTILFKYYLKHINHFGTLTLPTSVSRQMLLNEALLAAVALNLKGKIASLITRGAQIQPPQKKHTCPLGMAVKLKHLTSTAQRELVAYLFELGADANALGRHDPPFFEAIALKDMALINVFMQAGASVQLKSKTERTVLMAAIKTNNPQILEWALTLNPDVNSITRHKVTALSEAILAKNTAAIESLIERGARIHPFAPDEDLPIYQTPLFMAVALPDISLLKRFIYLGVPLNIESENKTLLLYAILNNHLDHARALISAGADINASTRYYDNTALKGALELKNIDFLYELMAAGARFIPNSSEQRAIQELATAKQHGPLLNLLADSKT